MIKISKKADYSVLLTASLALRQARHEARSSAPTPPASAQEIADQTGVSRPLVANLLKTLTRAGLLESVRGASGGYRLARTQEEISLAQIIEAVEGPIRLVECVDAPFDNRHVRECSLTDTCVSRSAMRVVHNRIAKLMEEIYLPELLQHEKRGSISRDYVESTIRS